MTTGQRLKKGRLRAGQTEADAARKANILLKDWQKYESDKVPIPANRVATPCQVLGINPRWLTKGKGRIFRAYQFPGSLPS
jgi:transcriptional regulator with XRE-family HTH domain